MSSYQMYQSNLSDLKAAKILSVNVNIKLIKLNDEIRKTLVGILQPIKTNYSLIWSICNKNDLKLSEYYVVLREIFGEGTSHIDDYKQGFSFWFLLEIKKQFLYVFNFYDVRGHIEFGLYKVLKYGRSEMTYHTFVPGEFSEEDYEVFVIFFMSFLKDFAGKYLPRSDTELQISPFIHDIESELYVYGYMNGIFFERSFDSQEKYYGYVNFLKDRLMYVEDKVSGKKQNKAYCQLIEMMKNKETG